MKTKRWYSTVIIKNYRMNDSYILYDQSERVAEAYYDEFKKQIRLKTQVPKPIVSIWFKYAYNALSKG